MMMALAAGLTLASTAVVHVREVTLGDLLRDTRDRRFTGAQAQRVVLRMPARQRRVTLTGPAVAALVRRATGFDVAGNGGVTIAFDPPVSQPPPCWRSTKPLAAGAVISIRDVAIAPCASDPARIAMRGGLPVVRSAVTAGAMLGRLTPATADRVAAGTTLTLRSVAGPVAIERPVTTLQPSQAGRSVFVTDAQGQVFAVPVAAGIGA
ncbi:hypothetical protein [Sphingomonas sp. CFBP 13720]|uniref:hypothetical protein n=1 Tax=Sphingomonas sp. CFBP 13720 TaxID=2775302 RepID=UPI001781147A|nr:hypothetical protein [Sphingomonas sp. CFBP 13720]MBD8679341.1 hypothetical protein [Sphingomonas sp. CFBP 13720]